MLLRLYLGKVGRQCLYMTNYNDIIFMIGIKPLVPRSLLCPVENKEVSTSVGE